MSRICIHMSNGAVYIRGCLCHCEIFSALFRRQRSRAQLSLRRRRLMLRPEETSAWPASTKGRPWQAIIKPGSSLTGVCRPLHFCGRLAILVARACTRNALLPASPG